MNSRSTRPSAWSPFEIATYRALWLAAVASSIGTWMHDIGAGWLMTTLSPTPVMVALVQVATSLPIFLFALPAGALADIIDRRVYLIAIQSWLALVAALLGLLTILGVTTAWMLVAATFAMGVGTALMMPAWAAVTPEVVPRDRLQQAITLNGMGLNAARALGPAVAGLIVSGLGSGAVFLLNAVSYLGVIAVLSRWRRATRHSELPSERFLGAIRSGLRFALHAPDLHGPAIRGVAFFVFASAVWALLPLIARDLVNGGPQALGLLTASLGGGAVAGAFVLPRLRAVYSIDHLIAGATLVYAGAMLVVAAFDRLLPLMGAMTVAGIAWITILPSLQTAVQLALPDWVRSRGLSIYMALLMGSMATGSLLWGTIAQHTDIRFALILAALGSIVAAAATWRVRIGGIEKSDLTPSLHWPAPLVHDGVTHERGPVLVTVHYRVAADRTDEFLTVVRELGRRRRRIGAFAWGVFEDADRPDRFVESFMAESWLEHLRQHERVTNADRALQDRLRALLAADPVVEHYVAPAGY